MQWLTVSNLSLFLFVNCENLQSCINSNFIVTGLPVIKIITVDVHSKQDDGLDFIDKANRSNTVNWFLFEAYQNKV